MALLCVLAAPIGLLGAVAARALVTLIDLLTNLFLFQRVSLEVPDMASLHPGWWLLPVAMLGGLLVSVIAHWVPIIRGHGIPEAMEAVVQRQSRVAPAAAVAKPISGAIAIGTGAPFGAEGPIVVTGSAIGSLIGQLIPVSPVERRVLLACGAAAGTAGIFGTPFAAMLLPLELLLFEFSTRSIVPLLIAAAVATAARTLFLHGHPFMPPLSFGTPTGGDLVLFALLGLVCGLAAVGICKGLFLLESGYRRLPIPVFWHPVIGGLGFALVGLAQPRILGVGYGVIAAELTGSIAGGALLALGLAKLLAWWVALGSGTSGGTLAPLLFIGGAFGGSVAWVANLAGMHVDPRAFALVAMAAVFGAATRAVLTGIVFMWELAAAPSMAIPLMLATGIAALVATSLASDSLMTEKLTRRGLRIHHHAEVDILRQTPVSAVMTRDVVTLAPTMSVGEARAVVAMAGHGAFPIVADRAVIGIVSRTDLLADDIDDARPVVETGRRDVVTVSGSSSVLDVLDAIVREEVEHVPVVDDGRLIGICTRTDVLRARAEQLADERVPSRGATDPDPRR